MMNGLLIKDSPRQFYLLFSHLQSEKSSKFPLINFWRLENWQTFTTHIVVYVFFFFMKWETHA
jgi:hypothetical protein